MRGAVVDGMKAPEKRDLVRPAMTPVETDLADDQSREKALPQRPSSDESLHRVWNEHVGRERKNRQRYGEQQSWNNDSDEVIAQILKKTFAKELLLADREQPLKRHKD